MKDEYIVTDLTEIATILSQYVDNHTADCDIDILVDGSFVGRLPHVQIVSKRHYQIPKEIPMQSVTGGVSYGVVIPGNTYAMLLFGTEQVVSIFRPNPQNALPVFRIDLNE